MKALQMALSTFILPPFPPLSQQCPHGSCRIPPSSSTHPLSFPILLLPSLPFSLRVSYMRVGIQACGCSAAFYTWNVASSRRIRSSKGRIWTKDYVIDNVSALITAPTFILPASQQSRCAAHNLLEIGLAKVAKHLN